jgi:hypothetical protein
MGAGEVVYDAFYRWFSRLTEERAARFAEQNPEPPGWEGFYALIRDNPWK